MEAPIKRSPQQQSVGSPIQPQQQQQPPPQQQQDQSMTTTSSTVTTTTSIFDVDQKSSVLDKFATLLSTTQSHRTKELINLLSTTVNDDQVVLMVPSLDLQLAAEGGGEQHGLSNILPQMGTHSSLPSSSSFRSMKSLDSVNNEGDVSHRPNMAASVLNRNTGTSVSALSSSNTDKQQQTLKTETVDSSIQTAAQNIGKQTSWTKSTLPYATNAVGTNITESFTTLFNSRLRAWTLILLRHSLSTGNNDSRTKLLGMLSAKIHIQSHEFCYRTLPLPEAAKNAKPIDSDIILPLLFEVSLNVTIQEKTEKVLLHAPGTISAIVDKSNSPPSLLKVNVQLDTGVFLKSMVDQARMVVLKAVASATETSIPSSSTSMSIKKINHITETLDLNKGNKSTTIAAVGDEKMFSDAPKRPTTTELERMQKARKSALRLNSVLHGKQLKGSVSSITLGSSGSGGSSGSTTGSGMQNDNTMRKVTSIRWDNSVQNPKFTSALTLTPNISVSQGTDRKKNRLESFKSFGRPHGGDFGSGPKNATFGDYGRPAFSGAWGRDGRLAAHPMPSRNPAVDSMGNLVGGSADLNATFDSVVLPSSLGNSNSGKKRAFDSTQYLTQGMNAVTTVGYRSSAASAGAALLGRLSNPPASSSSSSSESNLTLQQLSTAGPSASTLSRTATAIESSLMKKWS